MFPRSPFSTLEVVSGFQEKPSGNSPQQAVWCNEASVHHCEEVPGDSWR